MKFKITKKTPFAIEFESLPEKKGDKVSTVTAGYKKSALLMVQLRTKPVGTVVELEVDRSSAEYGENLYVISGRTDLVQKMNQATLVLLEQNALEQKLKNLGV